MTLKVLSQTDCSRYALSTPEQSSVIPELLLGLEDQGIPVARLAAQRLGNSAEITVLDCLNTWKEAPLYQLLTAFEIWALSNAITDAGCYLTLSQDQALSLQRLLCHNGWTVGQPTLIFSVLLSKKPSRWPQPQPSVVHRLLPFFQLPLPIRANFFSSCLHTDLADLGSLEPGLCIAYSQADRCPDGVILTGRWKQRYLAQAWLPEDSTWSEQMIVLLTQLCLRRNIHHLTLQTNQTTSAALIQTLLGDRITTVNVQLQGHWNGQRGE